MRIVIALGGNALLPKGSDGTAAEQLKAAERAIRQLAPILEKNRVVITHGNGPQVGNLLIQQNATSEVSKMPLDVLDAMSQGQIGYFIASAISMTGLHSATLITRVVVDPSDAAFRNPTKPIGPFYGKPVRKGMKMDSDRGYRLFVASPTPLKIRESDAVAALLKRGFVVVAVGGGGIPIDKKGNGLEAVIDKDRAASLLAREIGAGLLVFVTSVDCAYADFGKKSQKAIRRMDRKSAERYLRENQFAEGSMKPKIESALSFLAKNKRARVVVCSIEDIGKALSGKSGTTITR